MASRKLEDLHPDILHLAVKFISACKKEGIDVLVYCTFRPQEEQEKLYAKGRTAPGPKVTWTRNSKHSFMIDGKPASKAFDCVPLKMGKACWDDEKTYVRIAEIGLKCGLIWGGNWKKSRDCPHFELPA